LDKRPKQIEWEDIENWCTHTPSILKTIHLWNLAKSLLSIALTFGMEYFHRFLDPSNIKIFHYQGSNSLGMS
jgi:intein-encoded DNA endonuclease-like protein